jgi:hypothetical protein
MPLHTRVKGEEHDELLNILLVRLIRDISNHGLRDRHPGGPL